MDDNFSLQKLWDQWGLAPTTYKLHDAADPIDLAALGLALDDDDEGDDDGSDSASADPDDGDQDQDSPEGGSGENSDDDQDQDQDQDCGQAQGQGQGQGQSQEDRDLKALYEWFINHTAHVNCELSLPNKCIMFWTDKGYEKDAVIFNYCYDYENFEYSFSLNKAGDPQATNFVYQETMEEALKFLNPLLKQTSTQVLLSNLKRDLLDNNLDAAGFMDSIRKNLNL